MDVRDSIEVPPSAESIEAALLVVPGVSAATVVCGDGGLPQVLRLTLAEGADEVGVARAAHRILRLQFGVGLDPARIEVVEVSTPARSVASPRLRLVDDESAADVGELLDGLDPGPGPRFDPEALASAARHPAGASAPSGGAGEGSGQLEERLNPDMDPDEPRLAIARLALVSDGLGVAATVTLEHGGSEQHGTAEGPASPAGVQRSVAIATLHAISSLVDVGRLDVEEVSLAAVGSGFVAVVQVAWLWPDGAERLTGASEVRDDPHQAVIRATLDAVNRRIASHLRRP